MMWFKNGLALVGVLSLLCLMLVAIKLYPLWQQLDGFDPEAKTLYRNMAQRILQNQSAVDAMVVRQAVKPGLLVSDVDESVRLIANELNIKNVGELALYKEVEAMSGSAFRYIKIYMLCNAVTAASLVNYNDAFASYLPCRVILLEDKTGQLWLYTMDMNIMIHGGKPLPPALKAEAEKIRDTILEIMQRASQGDF